MDFGNSMLVLSIIIENDRKPVAINNGCLIKTVIKTFVLGIGMNFAVIHPLLIFNERCMTITNIITESLKHVKSHQ
jgi:hypothetical protein